MVFRQYRFLTAILVIGVIVAAIGALAPRYDAETANRSVEVAVDYSEVTDLAGATHKSVREVLSRLKESGATTVAVQEMTGAVLVNLGLATVSVKPGPTTVFKETIPGSIVPLSRPIYAPVSGTPDYALSLPYGLPAAAFDAAKKLNMPIVARLVNYPGVQEPDVELTAQKLQQLGVKTVIFASDQVLGFRGAIDPVAKSFTQNSIAFGSVEFSKQKGDAKMSLKMLPNVIRVHSITSAEMGTLDMPTAIERFVKAARERNIRLIYVRMFDMSSPDPLAANSEYVSKISAGLKKEGLSIHQAHPFKDPGVGVFARIVMAAGVAAGLMLLILSVVSLPARLVRIGTIVAVLMFAAMAAPGIAIGLKAVALASAIVFPTLAVLYAGAWTPDESSARRLGVYLWPSVVRFAGAVAISMTGGLFIAGLLARLSFMLHIDQFGGVKLATVLPLMFLAFAYAAGIGWRPDSWDAQKARVIERARAIGSQPLLMWQTGLGFVLLVMVAVLVLRSGNEPGVGVSSIELKFRSFLDAILFVRPRTKEFLVGHPALIFGIMAALGGRRNLASVLLVIGAFGEISLLNTMCHIHTPVAISIARGIIGAIVGILFAIVLVHLFFRQRGNVIKTKTRNVRSIVGVAK